MKKTLIYIFVVSSVIAGNSCTKNLLNKVNFNGLPDPEQRINREILTGKRSAPPTPLRSGRYSGG